MSDIITVTEENLDSEVYGASKAVLLDLWAPWCAPCRTLAPILEKLSALGGESLTIAKMDVEKYPEAMARFGVRGIPALLLFKDGKEISREVGTKTLTQLKEWMANSDIKLSEPAAIPTDTAMFGAFYGDPQLKQFFCDRLLAHAQRGEIKSDNNAYWIEGSGTPGAAWVHSADLVVFERLTGLAASFSIALDFTRPIKSVELEPIMHALKPGSDLSNVPLRLTHSLLSEALFDWPNLLSQSALITSLRNEWLGLCERYLAGTTVSEQDWKDLALRAKALNNHEDPAVRNTAELISTLSPPPTANNADGWIVVFRIARTVMYSIGQHLSNWTLEERQTEQRRWDWFNEKQSQSASGELSQEEIQAYREQWFSENEAYQLKEAVFFDNELQGLHPVLDCMRDHLATLMRGAPPFNPN